MDDGGRKMTMIFLMMTTTTEGDNKLL